MSKNKKKLIVGDFKKALKELVKQVMDEISTTPGVGPTAVPNWVSKNAKGRPDVATKSLPGYTIAEKKGEKKGEKKSEKKSEKKDKPVVPLVPVGKEKTPNVVTGPTSKGVKSDDLYVLHVRRGIAAAKKDIKDTEHYDNLIATGEKQLGYKPGTSKKK
jgi:hypothetical protein